LKPLCFIDHQQLEFKEQLGSGAFAAVSKVIHIQTRIEMAAKNYTNAAKDKKKLEIELKVLFESFSPHVIGYYGSYKLDSSCFLIIEYMDLGSFMFLVENTYRIPEHVLAKLAESVFSYVKEFVNVLLTCYLNF
jgi:serine/threonine protein kinase